MSNEDYIIITISDYAEAAEIFSNTHSNDIMGANKLITKIIYLLRNGLLGILILQLSLAISNLSMVANPLLVDVIFSPNIKFCD